MEPPEPETLIFPLDAPIQVGFDLLKRVTTSGGGSVLTRVAVEYKHPLESFTVNM